MTDEVIEPDWVSGPEDRGGPRSGSQGAQRPAATQPKDVPRGDKGAEENPLDEESSVRVRRFDGLRNRILAAIIPLLFIGLGALIVVVLIAALTSFFDGPAGQRAVNTVADSAIVDLDYVEPTRTMMVIWTGAESELVGLTLLGHETDDAGAGPSTSAMLFSPDMRLGPSRPALRDLWTSTTSADPRAAATLVAGEVATVFNVGVHSTVVFDEAALIELADTFDGLQIELSSELVSRSGGADTIVFPAGQLDLTAQTFADIARWLNPQEDSNNRLERQRLLWQALQRALPERGVEITAPRDGIAADAQLSAELSRAISALAGVRSRIISAPIVEGVVPGAIPTFDVELIDATEQMALVVRSPEPGPGRFRPRVRIIDAASAGVEALQSGIVVAGGQVISVASISGSDISSDRILAHTTEGGTFAEWLKAFTGVDQIEVDAPAQPQAGGIPYEFTVVVGAEVVQDGEE